MAPKHPASVTPNVQWKKDSYRGKALEKGDSTDVEPEFRADVLRKPCSNIHRFYSYTHNENPLDIFCQKTINVSHELYVMSHYGNKPPSHRQAWLVLQIDSLWNVSGAD